MKLSSHTLKIYFLKFLIEGFIYFEIDHFDTRDYNTLLYIKRVLLR